MKPSEYIRQGWCQGDFAKDAHGHHAYYAGNTATQWCVMGAIGAAYPSDAPEASNKRATVLKKLEHTLFVLNGNNISLKTWNDDPNQTKEGIIAILELIGE